MTTQYDHEIVEKYRPKRKSINRIKRENRKLREEGNTTKPVPKDIIKGLFVSFINPDNPDQVSIGFSMVRGKRKIYDDSGAVIFTHPSDTWDQKEALRIARERAIKWQERIDAIPIMHARRNLQKQSGQQISAMVRQGLPVPGTATHVPVPHSLVPDLLQFMIRCRKYYKGKELPIWVTAVLSRHDEREKQKNYLKDRAEEIQQEIDEETAAAEVESEAADPTAAYDDEMSAAQMVSGWK